MKRTTISPSYIYTLTSKFTNKVGADRVHKRGRPRTYSDALILAITGLKELYGLSYREALDFGTWFYDRAPSLSTFHYRVGEIGIDTLEKYLEFLGNELIEQGLVPDTYLMDGTGWSYHDVYPLKFLRGTEVRKVKSHVRAIALVGVSGKRRYVLSAISGRAYASEVKLGERLLQKWRPPPGNKAPFLADAAYDSISFLKALLSKGCLPIVDMKAKDSSHFVMRHPLRIESAKQVQESGMYNKRTLIEGLFGNTKEKLNSHIKVSRTDIAQKFALMRLALFNISLLAQMERVWPYFSNRLIAKGNVQGHMAVSGIIRIWLYL